MEIPSFYRRTLLPGFLFRVFGIYELSYRQRLMQLRT